MFDMQGMEMEFGGYGVPIADKEAMLRHFAPAISQDWRWSGHDDDVVRDAVNPRVCIHPLHISLFLFDEADVGALPWSTGRKIEKRTCRVCWVLVLLMALVLTLALVWTPVLMGWEGFYDLSRISG
jgi:hypothetical protein